MVPYGFSFFSKDGIEVSNFNPFEKKLQKSELGYLRAHLNYTQKTKDL